MITVGELITALFDRYVRRFGDEHLAALATQEHVQALLRRLPQQPRGARSW